MTPPEDAQGKGNTDLNVQHPTMEQIMLDHMKLCHPEWLDDLTESGELDEFIADHVDRAKEQYGRLVQDGVQPLYAYERSLKDHVLIDLLDESEKYHFTSERDEEPQPAEVEANAKPDCTVRTGKPGGSGGVLHC